MMEDIKLADSRVIELAKEDIESISVDCNEPSLYSDILNGVKNKRMFAFSGAGGFFVLMPILHQEKPHVCVMAAVSKKGLCFSKMLSFAKERTKEIGGVGLFFSTGNKKLELVAGKLGWKYRGRRGVVSDWLIEL
jgi:hypothetical protein